VDATTISDANQEEYKSHYRQEDASKYPEGHRKKRGQTASQKERVVSAADHLGAKQQDQEGDDRRGQNTAC
jgi:hypothetical protein